MEATDCVVGRTRSVETPGCVAWILEIPDHISNLLEVGKTQVYSLIAQENIRETNRIIISSINLSLGYHFAQFVFYPFEHLIQKITQLEPGARSKISSLFQSAHFSRFSSTEVKARTGVTKGPSKLKSHHSDTKQTKMVRKIIFQVSI